MLENQIDQAERRATLRNDLKVREQAQGGTFHQHALADAQTPRGRFSAVANAYVVGSKPDVASAYPAAASHQADPVGTEPPLGFEIDRLELGLPTEAQATDDPADAPSTSVSPSSMSEPAGSSLSSDGPAPEVFPAPGKRGHAAEPSPFPRRKL